MTQFAHKQLPGSEHDSGPDPLEMALKEAQGGSGGGGGASKQNALAKVHQIFRGRYHWVVILGLALGITGGILGYKRGKLTYTSTGTIRVKLSIPNITGGGDSVMEAYQEFVTQQMSALQSKDVIEKAVKNPQWAGLVPIENSELAMLDLLRRIKVTQKSELLLVEASDEKPNLATAAVNAVMATYKEMYVMVDPEKSDEVIVRLKSVQNTLDGQLVLAKKDLADKVKEAGSDQLDAEYTSVQEQALAVEKHIQEMSGQMALWSLEIGKDPLKNINDDELMMLEPELVRLNSELTQAKLQLDRVKLGTTSSSPREKLDVASNVQLIESAIAAQIERDRAFSSHGMPVPGFPKLHNQDDIDGLQAQIDKLTPRDEKLRAQLVNIGKLNLDLTALKDTIKEIQGKLDATRERMENERVNNPIQRRLEVLSEGEFPLTPEKDSRPKLAAVGGLGGFFMATMAVGLLGLMNNKLRAPHDLQIRMEAKTVLGIIPSLEEGPDFPQRAALASECVHRSRTMLEIWARGNKKMVIGVTSPTHGSGNTSVAMSLGVSFAAAGLKTLLVDCDFVTTGLTPRLQTHVRRELSTVLKRTGLVSETQLHHASRVATAEAVNGAIGQRSVGDVCVELGYITQAELDAAVAVQMKESIGILDALQGEDLRSCVGKTGIRNLSLLPRANATPAHASKLCSQSLRAVLDEAREHYDTIIIDTSAMLSGLEASIVASAVDGMVVTVARGEERSKLQKTLTRLKSLECPVAGIIFNHVLPGDMPTPAPLDGASVDHDALMREQMELDLSGRLAELGPLASSVVARVPVSERGPELG